MKTMITPNLIFRPVFTNTRFLKQAFLLLGLLFCVSISWGQIAQRGTATTNASNLSGSNRTLSIARPAGVVAGDVLIATIVQNETDNDNGGLSANTASGWTLVSSRLIREDGTGNGDNAWFGTILYRIADGTEGANFSFAMPNDRADMAIGSIVALSGVATNALRPNGTVGGPFDVVPLTLNNQNSDIPTATGTTVSSANAAVLMISMINNDRTFSNWSNSRTELFDHNTTLSDDASLGAAWNDCVLSGATGNGTVTLSGSDRSSSILLVLRRAVPFTVGSASSSPTLCLSAVMPIITHTTQGATGIGTATGLPAGVTPTWSSNTITISGTPTVAGTFNYSIPLTGGCSSVVATGTIQVNPIPTQVTAVASVANPLCLGQSVNLIASANSNSPTAVSLLNQNFNSATNNWTTTNLSTGGTPSRAAWTLRNSGYNNGFGTGGETIITPDASQFYLSDSDAQGTGGITNTTLVSPAFNTNGMSAVTINLSHYYRFNSGTDDRAFVEASTNGTNWTTLTTYASTQGSANAFTTANINLTSTFLNQSNVFIRLRFTGSYDWYWAVNSVVISGTLTTAPEANYSWTSNPAGFTSTAKNPIGLTPSVTTTYTVTATNSFGCSSTAEVTVVVIEPVNYTSVTADANDFAANQTTTLRVNGLTGTNANVSWFTAPNGNGDFLGSDAVLPNMGPGKYYVQITGDCGTPAEVSIEVLGNSNWTGAINTLWNVPGNWAENVVPNAYCKVSIGTAKTAEISATNGNAYNVVVSGTGVLTVRAGRNLTVTNQISTAVATNLIVESNANLVQINGAANTTPITVRRRSSALKRLDYIMWSTPVTGQNLLGFSPLTSVSPTSRFYTYNTTTNFFNSITAPGSVTMERARGYLVRVPNNHPTSSTIWNGQFVGVPHNGTISMPLTNSVDSTKRFNLVGNPYPSTISLAKFLDANQNNIRGTVYFWRKTNGAPHNSYWAISKFGHSSNGEGVNPNGVIQVGQGFIVEAQENATEVVFTNDMRILNNANQMFKTGANATMSASNDRYWLKMTNTNGAFSQIMVGYFAEATNGLDTEIDAKQIADGTILLSSTIGTEGFAIQGRQAPFMPTDIVPLSYTVDAAGSYTIALDGIEGVFEADTAVYLKDNETGAMHLLNNGGYTFTTALGSFANRFEIQYQTLLDTPTITDTPGVKVQLNGGQLMIHSQEESLKSVEVFDLNGRKLHASGTLDVFQYTVNHLPTNAVLIVKGVFANGQKWVKKLGN
jgi:trimeric autotransporter adhesin